MTNSLNGRGRTFIMPSMLTLIVLYVCSSMLLMVGLDAHTHHLHNTNKERTEDGGGFKPRNYGHQDTTEEHDNEFDHESILGSSKDAEEFDHLSPSEAKKRLEILIHKMDRNNDNIIERKELHSWIIRSFRLLSSEESEDKLDETDEDEDGFVTWEEHISQVYGITHPDDLSLLDGQDQEDEQKMLLEDRTLFNAADRNVDGRLDAAEFLSFSHPEEDPKMMPYILKQTLVDKDKNNDGYIDFQEYIGEKGETKDHEWLVAEKDTFDNEHDKDGDGLLDQQEIISWIVPSNEDIAEDEVDHLFAAADIDHDDELSIAEILDRHDIFVGSEATDYGDHLHNLDRFDDEL